jgi:hypothetical protein
VPNLEAFACTGRLLTCEQALSGGGLGEGDDVTDRGRARQEHGQAIYPECQPSVGWSPVLHCRTGYRIQSLLSLDNKGLCL